MKKLKLIATGLFFLLLASGTQAQTKTGVDYFAGKWKFLITGTPYGDLQRLYVLEKSNNTLTGAVQDWSGKEIAKCSNVEIKDKEAILSYQTQGIDVTITLTMIDEDHVNGNMLGMYEAKGERIK